jgi:hypothetical protein
MMWEAGTNYDNAISQRITSGQITDSLGIPATGQDILCTTMFNYILVDIFASIFGHGKASALIQRGVISSVIDLVRDFFLKLYDLFKNIIRIITT